MKIAWMIGDKKCEFMSMEDHMTKQCRCSLVLTFLPVVLRSYIVRIERCGSYDMMMEKALLQVAGDWSIDNFNIFPLERNTPIRQCLRQIVSKVGVNQVPIPAPFGGTLPVSHPMIFNIRALSFFKKWDMTYAKHYLMVDKPMTWWQDNIWKKTTDGKNFVPGTEWHLSTPDLTINCLRASSFFNRAFAGVYVNKEFYYYSVYSQDNLYPSKLVKLIDKYDKPTHKDPPLMEANLDIIPRAIKLMAESQGWNQHYGSIDWEYEQAIKDCIRIPMKTSAGGRPCPLDHVSVVGGVKTIITGQGKKIDQVLRVSKEIDEYVNKLLDNRHVIWPAAYNKVVVKSEVHISPTIDEEELKKIRDKAREYFIPTLDSILLSQLAHGYRQKLERGKLIRIGLDWNHGGMYEFYMYFRGFDDEMWYIGFDIKAYDTSVLRRFLEIYSTFSKVYINKRCLQYKVFLEILKEVTFRLGIKITQMAADVWRIIIGMMPSGAYETSHGDSWITALVFYCMFVYFMLTDYVFRDLFVRLHKEGKVPLSVYGDDNCLGFLKILAKWFTEERIASFFFLFANFTIRDFKLSKRFLSKLNYYGELSEKNVVFLQKYCIETPKQFQGPGMPPVVHARPASVNILKYAKGSGDVRTDLDYYLSAVTGIWDNPCNTVWTAFCTLAATYFKPSALQEEDIKNVIKNTNGYVTRMMRKNRLVYDDLIDGLPRVDRVKAQLRHDPNHHKNLFIDSWAYDLFAPKIKI